MSADAHKASEEKAAAESATAHKAQRRSCSRKCGCIQGAWEKAAAESAAGLKNMPPESGLSRRKLHQRVRLHTRRMAKLLR